MGLVDNLTPSSCADGELSCSLLHWWWSGVCWSPLFPQQFQEKVLFRLCFIRGLRCMVLSGSKLWNICDCLWSTWRSLFLWRSPSLPWSTRCRSRLWCGYCLERSGPLAIGRSTCFGFDCGKSTWSDCRSLLCLQVSSQPLRQRFGVSLANATDAWISSVLDESGPGPCSCGKNSWRRNKSSWPHLPAPDTTSGSGVVGVQWNDQIY